MNIIYFVSVINLSMLCVDRDDGTHILWYHFRSQSTASWVFKMREFAILCVVFDCR